MAFSFTPLAHRVLALLAALALPGLAAAQRPGALPAQALAAFAAQAKTQGLKPADVSNPLVTDSYVDPVTGLTHTYVQQRVNGLVIFNATGAVHTDQSGKVVLATQSFVPDAAASAPAPTPTLTAEQAVGAAAEALGLPRPVALRVVVDARPADGLTFSSGGISEQDILVRLLYQQLGGKLVLVWSVSIAQLDQQHQWDARIDAQTGRLVATNDYVVNEVSSFRQRAAHAPNSLHQAQAFGGTAVRSVLSPNAANSLTVIPMPFENPVAGPRVAVPLSAANPLYSPYGWQVAQAPSGTFANSYSLLSSGKYLTRGNNVAAYDDNSNANANNLASANLSSPTSSPDGGPALNFDFPFDQAKGARDPNNLSAGITNLFYWNNMLHDVLMAHGFDEAAGNFQYKNRTVDHDGKKLGKDGDFVQAEAQDGSGRNNANFAAPPDGRNGRMQLFLFDNVAANALTISSPSSLAGTYSFGTASFGTLFSKLPNGLSGTIVVVNDGVSADGGVHSCAAPYVNAAAVRGNIALIQRGGCTAPAANNFTDKVKLAQANGAVGAILFDSDPTTTTPLSPGGTDATVTIPVIGISGALGTRIKTALVNNALAFATIKTGPDFDGSFDSGVIAHEYGHGVSLRLTGGPANATCVNNDDGSQSMGEGWSDFFGLWMTTHPGDVGSTPRYVSTYSYGQSGAAGPGARRKPYSTDFTLNSYTYAQLGPAPAAGAPATGKYYETHDVGEVWATVLWDLNWQFIYTYGYNADFLAATLGGNNKMLRLVLDGCKLQVCNPGFLDGRDALLRADTLTNGAANADLIWNVFARRGMGYSARQGDRLNGVQTVRGITEGFDLPPTAKTLKLSSQNNAVASGTLEAYPNPAQDLLTVRMQLSSAAPVHVTLLDLLGRAVVPAATVPAAQLQQSGTELHTASLAAGIYVVRVTTSEGTFTTKVTIQH